MKLIKPHDVTNQGGTFTRASVASYYNNTGHLVSAAVNTPRFTFDPSDLDKPPVFITENAATNNILYSEGTVAQLGPSGNVIDASVSITDYTNSIYFANAPGVTYFAYKSCSLSAGQTATFSIVIQMDDNSVPIVGTSNLTGNFGIVFDQSLILTADAIITNLGNGKYRISYTGVVTGNPSTNYGIVKYNTQTSVGFKITAYQLEVGSKMTSYIATTGSPVTRAADVNTMKMLSSIAAQEYSSWSATTIYITGDRVTDVSGSNNTIYESSTGSTATVTMTVASPCVVTWAAHGLAVGTAISFTTTGALPTGLISNTVYYVIAAGLTADTFQISATKGGAAINTSGTQSGTHTARASTNYNLTPVGGLNTSVWLDAGATNRWKMFDKSVESQTSATEMICVEVSLSAAVDSVVLMNVECKYARVQLFDNTDGIVYDQTHMMIGNGDVTNFWRYMYYLPEYKDVKVFTGLPAYGNGKVRISLYTPGQTVKCGVCYLGQSRQIGLTQYGMQLGIQDSSLKEKDEFGNTSFVERGYAPTQQLEAWVENNNVTAVYRLLAKYRATPVMYIGADSIDASIQYGCFRDFSITVGFPTVSVCNIEIESLT